MESSARRIGLARASRTARAALAALALVVAPSLAAAQGRQAPPPGGAPPPAGGSAAQPGKALGGDPGPAAPAADDKKPQGEMGGYAYSDKPARRVGVPARYVHHQGGPQATFPGFEQLPDGGSRLFVRISQTVGVEERRAPGTITYVLRGAHLRVHNDSHALVTVHFNTPVYRARLTPQGNDLLFILELRSAAAPAFKVTTNADRSSTLMIDFAKGDFIPGDGSEVLPTEAARETRASRRARRGDKRDSAEVRQAPQQDDGDTGPSR